MSPPPVETFPPRKFLDRIVNMNILTLKSKIHQAFLACQNVLKSLKQSTISKIFRGRNPRTPIPQGRPRLTRPGRGRLTREGKGREGEEGKPRITRLGKGRITQGEGKREGERGGKGEGEGEGRGLALD